MDPAVDIIGGCGCRRQAFDERGNGLAKLAGVEGLVFVRVERLREACGRVVGEEGAENLAFGLDGEEFLWREGGALCLELGFAIIAA